MYEVFGKFRMNLKALGLETTKFLILMKILMFNEVKLVYFRIMCGIKLFETLKLNY